MASSPRSDAEHADYRPSDHIDAMPSADEGGGSSPGDDRLSQPKLGPVGWLRFVWRQLTSMRTALVLLLLLAIAAIPGSLVPQTSSDPNGVAQWRAQDPDGARVLDFFGLFSTFSSPWFSAIYLLLFISLIGCVIPRAWHHAKAIVASPPRTPARLERLEGHTTRTFEGNPADALDAARTTLRRRGYRVADYGSRGGGGVDSVSAERGYLRETGNLVFHVALIGVLASVGLGSGFGYTGQRVIAEGYAFTNVLSGYDSFNPGRFFTDDALAPYSVRLDSLDVTYEELNIDSYGAPLDFHATVTVTELGQEPRTEILKVNAPLTIAGTQVYLLGNGYAPVLTVRDPDGRVVFSQPTLFRPMDSNLGSLGVVKIPDGLAEQIGMEGFLYPTAIRLESGAFASSHPDLRGPLVTLEVYTGDLGLDTGRATNAYVLDTESLTQIAGRTADAPTIALRVGDRVDLPDGLGSVELTAIPRFAALDIHSDPAQGWVLTFVILAVAGLLLSLFIPRRRVWARVIEDADGVRLEWAGLARGEDPRLADAVASLADSLDPSVARG
ncbi:MAG TPA: cytochrome c biogenesis protein ResB [Microbacteriaceae bacterium]|nr:cytochrome c biogenesis protein ResB [Microbacteriaceae bacterium]